MAKEFFKNLFGNNENDEKKTSQTPAKSSNSGADINRIFHNWTRNHSDSPQNDLAVQLLQKQIENYEKEIEIRRQRLLEEMRSKNPAVVGFNKPVKPALQDTDDALPYKPILFDINKVLADIKAKRAAQFAAQSGHPLPLTSIPKTKSGFGKKKPPAFTKSIPANSKLTTVRSIKTTESQALKPKPTESSTASAASTTQSNVFHESSIDAKIESDKTTAAESRKKDETPSASNSSSEDSKSASEKQQGFAGILIAMIEEAEKPQDQKPKEPDKKLTGIELAAMSKNEPQKFDQLVLEHTKQCIFVTQPTSEESRNWNDRRARPEAKQKSNDAIFNFKQPFECRTFCITCKPRYPVPN